MTLSELICKYRTEHDLSQRQFAIKCDLSNGYISMLEKGENPNTGKPLIPTIPKLTKLAAGLGMTLTELFEAVDDMPIDLVPTLPSDALSMKDLQAAAPAGAIQPFHPTHRIPILGRISAGLPLYAEEHIEGYTYTDLNGGAEYFALKVHGDSMTAARIFDGDTLIIRRQETVDNGQIAVVMVGEDEATVKRFYQSGKTVTLMPQSTNSAHQPQVYDSSITLIRIIGLVVKNEITF